MERYTKDPDAVLDFHFVWAEWLEAVDDTLADHEVTADSGLTVDSSAINSEEITIDDETYAANTVVTAWLSGGQANNLYTVTCHMVTSEGREDDRSMVIHVKER